MYETHFGLLRRPFFATPDPDCFVPFESADNALVGLRLCIEGSKGFGILSAPAGTGKTLLCRKLIVDLRDRFATVFLANSNFPTRRSLLQAILYELGHPYMRMAEQELRLEMKTAAMEIRPEKEAVLLVVDEAHLLGNQLLDELRTAANIDLDGTPLIHVVLSGQLELEEQLIDPDLAALNQRVGCQVTLESMTREESAMYVAHRLQWAGADLEDVIQHEAMSVIPHAADGLPRCLNQLCDHSLLLSYVADERPVSEATVREALEDLKQLPLHWNEPAPASNVAAHAEPELEQKTEAVDSEPDWEEFPDDDTLENSVAGAVSGGNVIEVGENVIEVGENVVEFDESVIEVGETASVEVGASIEVGAPVTDENEVPSTKFAEPTAVVLEVGAMESVEEAPTNDEGDAIEYVTAIDAIETVSESIEMLQDETEAVERLEAVRPSPPMMPAATVHSSAIEEYEAIVEEEVVVDRYARLDAGLSVAGPLAAAVPQDGPTIAMQESPPAAAVETTSSAAETAWDSEPESEQFGYDLAAAHTPEQVLDVIEPLISQVLNDDRAWEGDSAMSISETVVGPPVSLDETEWAGLETGVQESAGFVEWTDDHVMAKVDADTPTDYDVVQPETPVASEKTQPTDERIDATEPKFQGRYAHLFSKLRRQQQKRSV